jgi:hypothetical protein
MKNYLDRMDEKIMKGLENNLKVSIQTINSQKETIEMLKTRVDKLEELNQRYKFHIFCPEFCTSGWCSRHHQDTTLCLATLRYQIIARDYMIQHGLIQAWGDL